MAAARITAAEEAQSAVLQMRKRGVTLRHGTPGMGQLEGLLWGAAQAAGGKTW